MKKINVLHVLEAVAGGTRTVVQLQMRHLDKSQFDVSICIPTISAIANTRKGELNDPRFGESIRNEGITVHEIAMLSEQLFSMTNIVAFVRLYRLCKKNKYDVVHCSSSIAGFLGRISAKLAGVPIVIYSPHGFSFFQNISKLKYTLYLSFEKLAGMFTDAFILSSIVEREESLKLKLSRSEKIYILENPIEIGKYHNGKKNGASSNRSKYIIGMVARLVPQKKPSDFVMMAHSLRKVQQNTEFVLVGGGRLQSEVETLVSELNVDRFSMLGNRSDYLEVMSTFDVLVMTSLWEGLPYAPIEALLLGIPTVLTDVSGVRDLLGKEAEDWIVPLNSPEIMASVVHRILMNYDVEKEKVVKIRENIIQRFNAGKIAGQLGDYYAAMLNKYNPTD